jgi:hypothetical protein
VSFAAITLYIASPVFVVVVVVVTTQSGNFLIHPFVCVFSHSCF